MGILLLYSYEHSWRALQDTQKNLIAANAIAIILGSALICFLVGKSHGTVAGIARQRGSGRSR